jgi:transposase InsO family protein
MEERAITPEFLSDNGGALRGIGTHALARELGITPMHTSENSPQLNGMTERFVNSFMRGYVGAMDRSNGAIVLAGMLDAFRHFNEYIRTQRLAINRRAFFGKSDRVRLWTLTLAKHQAVCANGGARLGSPVAPPFGRYKQLINAHKRDRKRLSVCQSGRS